MLGLMAGSHTGHRGDGGGRVPQGWGPSEDSLGWCLSGKIVHADYTADGSLPLLLLQPRAK